MGAWEKTRNVGPSVHNKLLYFHPPFCGVHLLSHVLCLLGHPRFGPLKSTLVESDLLAKMSDVLFVVEREEVVLEEGVHNVRNLKSQQLSQGVKHIQPFSLQSFMLFVIQNVQQGGGILNHDTLASTAELMSIKKPQGSWWAFWWNRRRWQGFGEGWRQKERPVVGM